MLNPIISVVSLSMALPMI